MPSQGHSLSPFTSSALTTTERATPEDAENYKCSCGTGDGTGAYIKCENEKCKVGWYHWECVQVTEEPLGAWLCPSCSPNAAFYIEQLVKKQATPPPVVPKIEKTHDPAASKRKERKQKQKPLIEIEKNEVADKGVAMKKRVEKKPKPKWIGWVELSSDGEEEFKKNVDAQWSVDHDLVGKRRRASTKAVTEESEPSPRALRARSRTEHQSEQGVGDVKSAEKEQTDSDESVYQDREVIEISSNNSDESDSTMDVDQRPNDTVRDSSDKLSNLASDSGEERSSRLRSANSASRLRDDDVQEFQVSVTAEPVVDYAARYERQGNCWGDFPESAIRSTLPRLG